jgi:hypothetical protein
MDLGYTYAATRYDNLDRFDLALHRWHAALRYRFAGFDGELSLDRFTARLADAAFVEINRVSPSLSRLFGDWLYLRGAFVHSEKSYDEHGDRDAVNDALRGDAYFLIDGMQRYFALTMEHARENALIESLGYEGISGKVAYGHRIDSATLPLELKGHVQVENREYASMAGSDQGPRRDERLRAGLCAVLPLIEHFELTGQAEYADSASTLEAASYAEMVYTVSVGARF